MKRYAAVLIFILFAVPAPLAYADPNDYYDEDTVDRPRKYDFQDRSSYAERERDLEGRSDSYADAWKSAVEAEERAEKERRESERYYEKSAYESTRFSDDESPRFDPLELHKDRRRADTHEIDEYIRNPHKRLRTQGEIARDLLTETR